MTYRKLGAALVLLAGMALVSGCSSSIPKHKVTGSVEIDGQPVAEGQLAFQPTDSKLPAEGATVKDGKYSANLAPGSYKVKLTATKKVPLAPGEATGTPGEKDKLVSIVPDHYNDQNPLTAEVKGAGEIDFKLTSKKK